MTENRGTNATVTNKRGLSKINGVGNIGTAGMTMSSMLPYADRITDAEMSMMSRKERRAVMAAKKALAKRK
jgi:hypothetical protein